MLINVDNKFAFMSITIRFYCIISLYNIYQNSVNSRKSAQQSTPESLLRLRNSKSELLVNMVARVIIY